MTPADPCERPGQGVLILTGDSDPHAADVATHLHRRDVPVFWFDYGLLPGRAQLLYQAGPSGSARRLLSAGDRTIDLEQVGLVVLRRPAPIVSRSPTPAQMYIKTETTSFLLGLLDSLRCPWFPAQPATIKRADEKIHQLERARRLGLEIPPTLITNQPHEALRFYNAHQGQVISKVAETESFAVSHGDLARYTTAVRRRDLPYLCRLRSCPALFQANVPKQLEVRVTVVGTRVFAAEIHSQSSRQAAQDWRRYDLQNTPHLTHRLPDEVSDQCVRLVEDLGLAFGAIDLILRPDGRYVFLEINPNGQYLWVQDATGLPISEAIAEHLASTVQQRTAQALTAA